MMAPMKRHVRTPTFTAMLFAAAASLFAQDRGGLPPAPTPAGVKPGSANCEECPYPYPSSYVDISVYTQDVRIAYPKQVERVVLYNPIGLTDIRYDRPQQPIDEGYKQTLASDYQSIRASLARYVAHNPKAWNQDFETYTRIRYSWTLGADWPRLAMVQALTLQMIYADPVVYDWAHIQVPTLAFGGADDRLPGTAAAFQERMAYIAKTIPNDNGRLLLLPGLGHVPHLEAPEKVLPPLVAFLKEGLTAK